ncbi:MAG: DUF4834 family protein [Ichthyobacteriaceae bacterium]|nr:DUF4834 family protein [Ichthyobacteriaceae bacterium]
MGLIRTILIIALIFYGIKFLARLFAPQIMGFAAKKMQEKFGQQFNQEGFNQQDNTREPEGKTTIIKDKKKPGQDKFKSDDAGDYTDFEELDK